MQIVEISDVDKATVSKYLSELVNKGTIVLKSKRKQGIEKYTLTLEGRKETKILLEKQKIKKQIDQMSTEKFLQFKKFLDFMLKSKEGTEFLLQLKNAGNNSEIKKFKNIGTIVTSKD